MAPTIDALSTSNRVVRNRAYSILFETPLPNTYHIPTLRVDAVAATPKTSPAASQCATESGSTLFSRNILTPRRIVDWSIINAVSTYAYTRSFVPTDARQNHGHHH